MLLTRMNCWLKSSMKTTVIVDTMLPHHQGCTSRMVVGPPLSFATDVGGCEPSASVSMHAGTPYSITCSTLARMDEVAGM